jgi:hypothetical protein
LPLRFHATDCFQGHYELWGLGIHHNDISVGNLMHFNKTGVLNDLDLAHVVPQTPEDRYSHGQCEKTGTLPFMSLDLLTSDAWLGNVERLYRHDLESFMWVFLWICGCYDNGLPVSIMPERYKKWAKNDPQTCYDLKTGALHQLAFIQRSHRESKLDLAAFALKSFWKDFYNERSTIHEKHEKERNKRIRLGQPLTQINEWKEQSDWAMLEALVNHIREEYEGYPDMLSILPNSSELAKSLYRT